MEQSSVPGEQSRTKKKGVGGFGAEKQCINNWNKHGENITVKRLSESRERRNDLEPPLSPN